MMRFIFFLILLPVVVMAEWSDPVIISQVIQTESFTGCCERIDDFADVCNIGETDGGAGKKIGAIADACR